MHVNHLLSKLGSADLGLLGPHLEEVELALGELLEEPNSPPTYVFFPLDCLGSTILISPDDQRAEVFMFGLEHMTGGSVVNGDDRSPFETTIQHPGRALRIPLDAFKAALGSSPSMQKTFLLANQTRVIQMASTALANARHNIEQRLARWILMAHDRVKRDELDLTHEFLAIMLGVRRAGVTTAVHVLEGEHMIRNTRGKIEVRDREKLIAYAKGSYGLAEAEYERLIGCSI